MAAITRSQGRARRVGVRKVGSTVAAATVRPSGSASSLVPAATVGPWLRELSRTRRSPPRTRRSRPASRPSRAAAIRGDVDPALPEGHAQPVDGVVADRRAGRGGPDLAAGRVEEHRLAVAHLGREAELVEMTVMATAGQEDAGQLGLAAIDPVVCMVRVQEPPVRAARIAARPIACLERWA